MTRPSRNDRRAVADFVEEIETISLASPWLPTAERVRALLGVDAVYTYQVAAEAGVPRVAQVRIAGDLPVLARAVRALQGKPPPGLYSADRPEPAQRNRVLAFPSFHELLEHGWPARWLRYVRSHAPPHREALFARLADYARRWSRTEIFAVRQLRALVCTRSNLLLYVNAMHVGAHPSGVRYRFSNVLPALHRRLAVEEQLARGTGERLVLDAALEHIGSAVYVLGERGQLLHANAVGRAAFDRGVARQLEAAVRGEATGYRVTPLRDTGSTWHLVVESGPRSTPAARALAAAARWRLSQAQTRVLFGVVEGLSNKAIAAELGLAENTVEYHVTRILTRVGVEHRAALVARVWSETA